MTRLMTMICAVLLFCVNTFAQQDTLYISSSYTSHMIFSTDITYADLSNSTLVAAKIVEQNRNIIALKAREEFTGSTSISVLESNGHMYTFIVAYRHSPTNLIRDMRTGVSHMKGDIVETAEGASDTGMSDAPLLHDIVNSKQELYHLGQKKYKLTFLCERIVSYSDMTYIVLSLKNRSGVSHVSTDATFVLESKRKGKRTVSLEKTIFPNNRYGSLSAGPGETGRIAYSFDKMTLSEDQVLKVYLYEDSGQRNLEITLDTRDINAARKGGRRHR